MHSILEAKSVIFFDVGFTIMSPASGGWLFTNKFIELAGGRLKQCSPEQVREARDAGARYLKEHHLTKDEDEQIGRFCRYYEIVSESLKLKLGRADVRTIAEDWAFNMENYILYPDTKKVLETLSADLRLGIISDTWPSIEPQLRTLDVRKYFSFTTYSYSLGVYKPDPQMYRDALRKCGCGAKETVFIDDLSGNLAGAAAFGITPVLIAANPASDVDTPFLKIHALSELI